VWSGRTIEVSVAPAERCSAGGRAPAQRDLLEARDGCSGECPGSARCDDDGRLAILEFHLPAGATAPALARATLSAVAHAPRDVAGDVMLLTSELVTNAIRHSGSAPLDDVVVRVDPSDDVIHIEVLNPGPSFDPQVPATPSQTGTGLGLFLVDRLANRWGVEREGERTKVWFEVLVSEAATG